MKRSTQRILTTHAGSLARPTDLLEMMDARLRGENYSQEAYSKRVRSAVADAVREQIECGVDYRDRRRATQAEFQCLSRRVWAKFQAMAEGAQIATKQLWS